MVYVLYDCPLASNDKAWLSEELRKFFEVRETEINHTLCRLEMKYGKAGKIMGGGIVVCQCFRTLLCSQNEDVIICWTPLQGLCMYFLAKLVGGRRIITMNWLTPPNKIRIYGIKKVMAAAVKRLLRDGRVYFTVNSHRSVREWIETIGAGDEKHFLFLPDVYDTRIPFVDISEHAHAGRDGYCFMGGMANRNWELLVEIACLLPNVKFCCIALQVDWEAKVQNVPPNVKVVFNTKADEYYLLMRRARLVLLPLVENKSSGLINVIRAAQYGQICLASDFDAISQYYGEASRECLLPNRPEVWADSISRLIKADPEDYARCARTFQYYVRTTFSPEQAGKILDAAIRELMVY